MDYPPFNGDTDTDIMKAVKKGKFDYPSNVHNFISIIDEEWENISKEAKDLINNMLKYNPKERFSAQDCLSHQWFKNMNQDAKKTISFSAVENMKHFKTNRKLEQATISFIVNQLITKE